MSLNSLTIFHNSRFMILTACSICIGAAQVSVLTYHNDNHRSGLNPKETILTPANVRDASFGKLFQHYIDGQVYAQPLYVPGVAISGKGTHNAVFVATGNDSVYAFDADTNTGANAAPLWHAAFTNPANGITAVSSSDVTCNDLAPLIGISGTPVIDRGAGTLFMVAKTKEVVNGVASFYQRLH